MARTHGKASTYNNARCRCDLCKAAIAEYRANRRAMGFDLPERDTIETQEAS